MGLIQMLLGFLTAFGNTCCGCPPDSKEFHLYDCDHNWDGSEYDFNGDNVVSISDLNILLKTF